MRQRVAFDPKNVMARDRLDASHQRQGDTAKAEETLRQASDDLADTSAGADLFANYLIRTKQLDRADAAYTGLISKHPKSAPLKLAYSRILLLKKDLPKARTVLADLTKTDSGLPDVAILNSMLLLNDGKTNEAFDTLQKAAKANPENIQVKLWLGRAARAKGDLTVAQQSFRDATRLNPTSLAPPARLPHTSTHLPAFNRL